MKISFFQVCKKLLLQCAVPAILAVIYAYWVYIKSPTPTVTDAVSTFALAFFFVMWFVGQYLRAAKQIQDADSLKRLGENVIRVESKMADKDDVVRVIEKTYDVLKPGATSQRRQRCLNRSRCSEGFLCGWSPSGTRY